MHRLFRSITAPFILTSVIACGGETDEPDGAGGAAAGTCENTTASAFSLPFSKTGTGGVEITLVGSEPSPPIIGDNTWTVRVMGADGEPVVGATLTVEPFMPAHGHYSNRDAIVTDNGDGTYEVERVNFMMAGDWETQISVTSEAGTDRADFTFCFE